jgi:hypothetical protein
MMKLNEYGSTILFDLISKKRNLSNFRFNNWNFKRISLFKILVEGHTDSDGSNEMNQTLSENRAAALKTIWLKMVLKDRLNSTGFGETNWY